MRTGAARINDAPQAVAEVAYTDLTEATAECDLFARATAGAAKTFAEPFMTAASPGVIAHFLRNEHYPTREAYLARLVDVMKEEYDAIARAGFVLQIDCPDLAMSRHLAFPELSNAEFLKIAAANVEALNHALRDIPPDRLRMHLCWGNYEGPHHRDIPLREILPIVLRARPHAISLEGANARHGHEWAVFKEIKLPDDKILIPGVLDSTTNFIEHPELVAQRIVRYAEVVGRERVIAGSDCGFGTFARAASLVEPEIVWEKLRAMAEGARLASRQLWR
jgi:5-methyltetrahydropteroyltriglutamate--homocysteine methyltransferase